MIIKSDDREICFYVFQNFLTFNDIQVKVVMIVLLKNILKIKNASRQGQDESGKLYFCVDYSPRSVV